jgi:hypothetical protein
MESPLFLRGEFFRWDGVEVQAGQHLVKPFERHLRE